MKATTLQQLIAKPPLGKHQITLPDGRTCIISELPVSVIDRVRTTDEGAEVTMDNVVYLVAYALSGGEPDPETINSIHDSFGARAVMAIYTEALKFSSLTSEGIEQAKKG